MSERPGRSTTHDITGMNNSSTLEQTRLVDQSPTRPAFQPEDNDQDHDHEGCPFSCCERVGVEEHILNKGFFEGACSDITIIAFGKRYNLHRLILCRSGYFKSFFMGPWADSEQNELSLVFDHDPFLTKEAFDLALLRIYGASRVKMEQDHVLNMIAMGQYLDIPELVCHSTAQAILAMSFKNIARLANFATQNDYGQASERILQNIMGFMCSNGFQAGVRAWDGLPASVIASVVGMDSFFVPSEWDRALFIVKLIERRLRTQKGNESISSDEDDGVDEISETLNTKVYFCHLTPEQLHKLENMKDLNGAPYIRPHVLRDALWLSVQLHKKVATADERSHDLGLTTNSEQPADQISSWFVPTKDETLYGSPADISDNITRGHHIREDLPSGKTTENADAELMYRVTKIPPFRFSIAFSGVSELEAEKRVYAKTLWYAGSYWNLYIQKIRHRKGFQMGVYIHRATSCAPSRSGLLNKDVINASFVDEDLDGVTASVNNLNILDPGDNPTLDESDGESSNEVEVGDEGSFLSYEDKRIKTSVYYIIYTPSRKSNSALTCFISTPDLFKKSQSWGWKSNSLCSFNEDGTLADGQEKLLKFMVVLGNT